MLAVVVAPAVKSPAMSVVLTVVAAATLALLYVPLALVTVNASVPTSPVSEKLLAASVAVSFPSYPLVGSLTIVRPDLATEAYAAIALLIYLGRESSASQRA